MCWLQLQLWLLLSALAAAAAAVVAVVHVGSWWWEPIARGVVGVGLEPC